MLVLINQFDFISCLLREEGLDDLVGCPKHPVGSNNVKVAEALAVKILQHRDHAQRELDQSHVAVGPSHPRAVVDAVDAWLQPLRINLLYCCLDDEDAIADEVVNVLGSRHVISWLDEKNNAVVFSRASNRHDWPFEHSSDLFRVDLIRFVLKAPADPWTVHLPCLLQVEVSRPQETDQLVSVQIVWVVFGQEALLGHFSGFT